MTPDIRDIIILVLIVLNIAQIFITRGHIPPELVDKLFDFAAAKAAQTPDPNDEKLIDELRSIANALLSAQSPVEPAKTVIPDKPSWPGIGTAGGTVPLAVSKVAIGDPPGSVSSISISGTPLPNTTTVTYSAAQDFDSPVVP